MVRRSRDRAMELPMRHGRRAGFPAAFQKCLCVLALASACMSLPPSVARAQVTIDAAAGQPVTVAVGQGRILRFDQPVESVFIADTSIADLRVVSPGVVYIYALKTGNTNLMALSADQSTRGNVQLRVIQDPRPV